MVDKDISGVLLGENALIRIMGKKYKKKVTRIETQQDNFKVCFDSREDINAIILGPEDITKVLREHYGRSVINVSALEHEEYLVRFSD